MCFVPQGKKLKNWYIQEYRTGTTFELNILKTHVYEEVQMTMVHFNSKVLNERLDGIYKRTSGWNDRWLIRLKLIQEEYYSIGNQKS